MGKRMSSEVRMQWYRDELSQFARQVAELGFIWPGSIQGRWLTCGNKKCACHKGSKKRHGPYYYWTSKKYGKTISRLLPREEAILLLEWVENRRALEALVRKMKALSARALKTELKLRKNDQE